MLQHQIETIRSAVDRALLRIHPPAALGILKEHADFLGAKYDLPKPQELSAVEQERRRMAKAMYPPGKKYGPIVMVKLSDLYVALRSAKGVNHPEYQAPDDRAGRDETEDPDHRCPSATA